MKNCQHDVDLVSMMLYMNTMCLEVRIMKWPLSSSMPRHYCLKEKNSQQELENFTYSRRNYRSTTVPEGAADNVRMFGIIAYCMYVTIVATIQGRLLFGL